MIWIGFTGSQEGMTDAQRATLTSLLSEQAAAHPKFEFHHGDCIGSDQQANYIAKTLGAVLVAHPPIDPSKRAHCVVDKSRPPLDYLDRNKEIVRATNVLYATPNKAIEQKRSGTWSTVRFGRKEGRKVVVVLPDGSTTA